MICSWFSMSIQVQSSFNTRGHTAAWAALHGYSTLHAHVDKEHGGAGGD